MGSAPKGANEADNLDAHPNLTTDGIHAALVYDADSSAREGSFTAIPGSEHCYVGGPTPRVK
jgi:hypothetical protein